MENTPEQNAEQSEVSHHDDRDRITSRDESFTPNLFDPELLDGYDCVIPDSHISFPHPFKLGELCDIPIRLLTVGEAMTFLFSIMDKRPEMPDHIKGKKRSDLNAEERKLYTDTQEKIDAVMDEAYTDVTREVALQAGWTRERVAKLPLSTRMDGYIKAMRGVGGEASLSAETFPETRNRRVSADASNLSSGTSD